MGKFSSTDFINILDESNPLAGPLNRMVHNYHMLRQDPIEMMEEKIKIFKHIQNKWADSPHKLYSKSTIDDVIIECSVNNGKLNWTIIIDEKH